MTDTSRKIRTVFQAKGKSGKHLTSTAIYGYRKDPENKNQWLIDEESAVVVQRIFQMTVEGKGPYQIARTLTDEKIIRPSVYIAQRDGGAYAPKYAEDPYSWHGKTVSGILKRREYTGCTVNFRTERASYKDKRKNARPEENWLIFENTQEPIIDLETWETAQKCRKVKRRPNSIGEPNPLTGLVYCADCGSRMYNHRTQLAATYQSQDAYACQKYTGYPKKCTMHYISTSTLRDVVLAAIRTVSSYVKEHELEFIRQVREMHDLQSTETAKVQQRQLAQSQKRHRDLDSLIKQLYEDKVSGSLSAKRFDMLSSEYEAEQEGLERQIAELQAAIAVFDTKSDNTDRFIKMVRRYTEIPELTATILNEYIERIVVFEPNKSTGRRIQDVDIYFSFIGKIDIPAREEAEAEPFDPVEHRKAQFRAYYYRSREKILAKLAEKRAEEKATKLAVEPVKTPEELAAEEETRRERKRAYQREYQREWQKKRRQGKATTVISIIPDKVKTA